MQRPLEQGGAEGKVIYVDTEGTFRPQKIVAIAERWVHVFVCLYIYIYVCVCLCACWCVWVLTCFIHVSVVLLLLFVCICMYMYMCVCMCVCICVCVCVCMCVYLGFRWTPRKYWTTSSVHEHTIGIYSHLPTYLSIYSPNLLNFPTHLLTHLFTCYFPLIQQFTFVSCVLPYIQTHIQHLHVYSCCFEVFVSDMCCCCALLFCCVLLLLLLLQ